ncbi:MAG: GNAT family N-acetyltransferase [Clostridia bacterium]|nr:GNAT family N-acetyltransferase [Clostridia bacterium]
MIMRYACVADAKPLAELEAVCFPPAEAATEAQIRDRLEVYPNHFLLLLDDEKVIGYVNGMVTDERELADEMYADASMHNENGAWQMIFGVDVHPDHRCRGNAAQMLRRFIDDAKAQGRVGLVLTCKDRLVHYYAKFGFVDEGISESTHGNVVWHAMRLTF